MYMYIMCALSTVMYFMQHTHMLTVAHNDDRVVPLCWKVFKRDPPTPSLFNIVQPKEKVAVHEIISPLLVSALITLYMYMYMQFLVNIVSLIFPP